MNIRHILYPYDFSCQCQAAAPFVRGMAEKFKSRITLVSVLRPIWDIHIGEPSMAHALEAKTLKSKLDGALLNELAGLQVERIVQQGDPASMVVDYAHSHGMDMIMMPTHGVGPFRALLLGSVTAKVLHDAQCAVWTSPHVEDSGMAEHAGFKNILCAFDGTPKGERALRWARDFAKAAGAELHIVHAVLSLTDWASLESERQLQERVRREAEEAALSRLEALGIGAPFSTKVGPVATVTREEALRCSADLVVVGRGVLTETFGRLRTSSLAVIRESPCPVMSV